MYIVVNKDKKRVRGFDIGGALKVFRPAEQVILSSTEMKSAYENPRFRQLVIIGGLLIYEIEDKEKPAEKPKQDEKKKDTRN